MIEKVKDDSNDLMPDGANSSSDEDQPDVPDERQTAGLRKRGVTGYQPQVLSSGVGNWERHTKGIGAKLLLQVCSLGNVHKYLSVICIF